MRSTTLLFVSIIISAVTQLFWRQFRWTRLHGHQMSLVPIALLNAYSKVPKDCVVAEIMIETNNSVTNLILDWSYNKTKQVTQLPYMYHAKLNNPNHIALTYFHLVSKFRILFKILHLCLCFGRPVKLTVRTKFKLYSKIYKNLNIKF